MIMVLPELNLTLNKASGVNIMIINEPVLIYFGVLLSVVIIKNAQASEYFNPALLQAGVNGVTQLDLSSFEEGKQAAGKYHVDIYINGEMVDSRDVNFFESNEALSPCLTSEMIKAWGFNSEQKYNTDGCFDIASLKNMSAEFRFNQQELLLSVPQAFLAHTPRGYVDPSKWDEGINAATLNYAFNNSASYGDNKNQSQYLNLRPGFNLAGWHFRNYSTWNRDDNGTNNWDSLYSYVAHDIHRLRSQFVLGDTNTAGTIFDSVAFRGFQVASDDNMLPQSQRGYAPRLTGIARTNATVTVLQNGYTIYKTNVSPGPFEINDLYPASSSGDLTLKIQENDGSQQIQIVPYSTVPMLVRDGSIKYQLAAGKTRIKTTGSDNNTSIAQYSMAYGLPWGTTVYTGMQYSQGFYSAYVLGSAFNLGQAGAISLDVTKANTSLSQGDEQGNSWRLRYSKDFLSSGTNVVMSGYRYSTKGYYSLQDALNTNNGNNYSYDMHLRSKTDLTLAQSIFGGSVTASVSNQQLWNNQRQSSISFGYSGMVGQVSYGVNYTYNKQKEENSTYSNNNQISLNISVPLSIFSRTTSVSYSMSSSADGGTSNNVVLGGTALEQNNLNWTLQQGYNTYDHSTNSGAGVSYTGSKGSINANYSYSQSNQNVSYGAAGGVLLSSHGLTFTQTIGDTSALVVAPGADGLDVGNQIGLKTDSNGLAVVSSMSPYQINNISINNSSLKDNDIELKETSKRVIPTYGAIVLAKYKTALGNKVLFTLSRPDQTFVPFGATVTVDNKEDEAGIVAMKGQVYMAGLEQNGRLYVKWGSGSKDFCYAPFTLQKQKDSILNMQTLICN